MEDPVWHYFFEKKVRAMLHTLLRLAGMGTRSYLEERIRALGRLVLASADDVG